MWVDWLIEWYFEGTDLLVYMTNTFNRWGDWHLQLLTPCWWNENQHRGMIEPYIGMSTTIRLKLMLSTHSTNLQSDELSNVRMNVGLIHHSNHFKTDSSNHAYSILSTVTNQFVTPAAYDKPHLTLFRCDIFQDWYHKLTSCNKISSARSSIDIDEQPEIQSMKIKLRI